MCAEYDRTVLHYSGALLLKSRIPCACTGNMKAEGWRHACGIGFMNTVSQAGFLGLKTGRPAARSEPRVLGAVISREAATALCSSLGIVSGNDFTLQS